MIGRLQLWNSLGPRPIAALLAVTLSGCAVALNYTDPEGPRFVGGASALPVSRKFLRLGTFTSRTPTTSTAPSAAWALLTWDGPVIAGGDLNSRAVGERFEAAGFQWLTKPLRKTVGPFTFDHLFARGLPGAETTARASVVRTCPGVSDHWPVVAEIGHTPANR